jgi:hypothetical protein
MQLRDRGRRFTGLRILIEQRFADAPAVLAEAVGRERDPEVRATELLLIGLGRDPRSTGLLTRFLGDADPAARAAAADALGVVHKPAYPIPVVANGGWPGLNDPHLGQINLTGFLAPSTSASFGIGGGGMLTDHPQPLADATRAALREIMLGGTTAGEREAAARALLPWPPKDYTLRVAEWGVWAADEGGARGLRFAHSQLDTIPPFVHRVGNPADSFGAGLSPVTVTWKPVIHLSAGEAMAVDLEVQIRHGRPWFAYPKPDDFSVTVENVPSEWRAPYFGGRVPTSGAPEGEEAWSPPQLLWPLDPGPSTALAHLTDRREGYPWLNPSRRTSWQSVTWGRLGGHDEVTSIGLRWQGLIVSPQRLDWMEPAAVPVGGQFDWWRRLRDAPCAWVSSRGESERFLYYDGPSLAPTPVAVRRVSSGGGGGEEVLHFRIRAVPTLWGDQPPLYSAPVAPPAAQPTGFDGLPPYSGPWISRDPWLDEDGDGIKDVGLGPRVLPTGANVFIGRRQEGPPSAPRGSYLARRALRVRVEGGRVVGRLVDVPDEDAEVRLTGPWPLAGEAVAEQLRTMLTEAGLKAGEAGGLIEAWRGPFFAEDGDRLLVLMSAADYDTLCPMRVRPEPTEVVRVGVVLTELGRPQGAGSPGR